MRKILNYISHHFGIFLLLLAIFVNATCRIAFGADNYVADVTADIPVLEQKSEINAPEQKTIEIAKSSGLKPASKKCAGEAQSPVRIMIPSLSIDKCIQKEFLKNNQMATPNSVPAFLAPSQYGNKNVNQGGNTFIYGHNKAGIFGNLGQIKDGAKIELELGDGSHISYTVHLADSYKNYNYFDINHGGLSMASIISKTHGKESISIMTCAGEYDASIGTNNKRHIIIAVRD